MKYTKSLKSFWPVTKIRKSEVGNMALTCEINLIIMSSISKSSWKVLDTWLQVLGRIRAGYTILVKGQWVFISQIKTLGQALATALSAVQDGPLPSEGNRELGEAPGRGRMRMWVNSSFPTLEHRGEIIQKLCSALQLTMSCAWLNER